MDPSGRAAPSWSSSSLESILLRYQKYLQPEDSTEQVRVTLSPSGMSARSAVSVPDGLYAVEICVQTCYCTFIYCVCSIFLVLLFCTNGSFFMPSMDMKCFIDYHSCANVVHPKLNTECESVLYLLGKN